jgi:hypothetical protein
MIGSIFVTLATAHNEHGISHQDYGQYHTYCTARLARLRRVKEVRSLLVHNPKYVSSNSNTGLPQRKGGRHGYAPRSLPQQHATGSSVVEAPQQPVGVVVVVVPQHENILWNLLIQAERAWAHACEMQQQKGNRHHHQHVQRRFNKASKLAQQAVELHGQQQQHGNGSHSAAAAATTTGISTIRQQELHSYAAWMKGNAALEQKRFVDAFNEYQESRQILCVLVQQWQQSSPDTDSSSSVSGSNRERLAVCDTWTTRAEALLKPLVRYCHYEARDQLKASDVVSILDENKFDRNAAARTAESSIVLTFRGRDISLENYKELAVVHLKLQDQLQGTKNFDETHFLQVLSDLDDALNWTTKEYSHFENMPPGPAVNAKRQELRSIQGYFSYQKHDIWRQQQEGRVKELTTASNVDDAAVVHVYDTLLQNAKAMADLPADQHDHSVEDDPYWLQAVAHVVRIRACRCYYLARLYESSSFGTPAQVLALLRQAANLAKRAQEEVAAVDDTDNNEEAKEHVETLKELESKIRAMTCRAQATRFLQSQSQSTSLQTDRPLWLRLEDFDSGTVIADDPPLFIPIPAKPVFYDICWEHVAGDFPVHVIAEYLAEHAPNQKNRSTGFFGWLKSSS